MKENNAFFKKSAFLLLAVIMIISSCKKDQVSRETGEDPKKDEKLYETLLQNGVKSKNIVDLEEYYLVQGDLLFKKNKTDLNEVTAFFKQEAKQTGSAAQRNSGKTSQWQTPDIISSLKVESIKYSVSLPPAWRTSVLLALEKWSSVQDVKINFYLDDYLSSPSPNDNSIYFTEDGNSLPSNVLAAAEFPSGGNSGFRVLVNLDFYNNYPVTDAGKLYNMVHEIGHCLGFRHSNMQSLGEPQLGAGIIPGTPSSDVNSVMNGGTALSTWNGFSAYDITAVQTLYPYGPYDKWLTSQEGKYSSEYGTGFSLFLSDNTDVVPIKWNQNLVSTNTVTLTIYQNGQYVGALGSRIPNTGSFSSPLTNYLQGTGNHSYHKVQIKITSDDNPSITDFTSMFFIMVD